MRYETPELTALTPAINAIQGNGKTSLPHIDLPGVAYEMDAAYADWE